MIDKSKFIVVKKIYWQPCLNIEENELFTNTVSLTQ